jgi:hypothetical protein
MTINGGIRIGGLSVAQVFDPDAAAYVTTAGVTDATAKTQINDFVKGIKNLGLWSNIISWPLRSAQNAGTGTTAYSLGGLITKNGTLTNGPTWGTDGINFDGANDYINVPFTEKSGYTSHNFGTIASLTSVADTRIAVQGGGPWVGIKGATGLLTVSDDGADTSLGAYTLNDFFGANYDKTGGSYKAYRAGNLIGTTSTAVTLSSSPLLIGTYATNFFFWSGTIAFAHLFDKSLTDDENLSLYNLYKTTLGTGLGLP